MSVIPRRRAPQFVRPSRVCCTASRCFDRRGCPGSARHGRDIAWHEALEVPAAVISSGRIKSDRRSAFSSRLLTIRAMSLRSVLSLLALIWAGGLLFIVGAVIVLVYRGRRPGFSSFAYGMTTSNGQDF